MTDLVVEDIPATESIPPSPTLTTKNNVSITTTTTTTTASIVPSITTTSVSRDTRLDEFIKTLQTWYHIDVDTTKLIQQDLLSSLEYATAHKSPISMLPMNFDVPQTFYSHSHESKHDDVVLSIDIGGSTIRIALLKVVSSQPVQISIVKQEQWVLSEADKVIDSKFFKDLAIKSNSLLESVPKEYKRSITDSGECLKVGITWSFPLDQDNKILNLGKGFIVDEDTQSLSLDTLVENGFSEFGLKIDLKAIINDSVAVSLAGMPVSTESQISLILGTGVNSCILHNGQFINTELGFFGKLFNVTKYDSSINKNWNYYNKLDGYKAYMEQSTVDMLFQPIEFLTSSRYICESLRLIILDLIDHELINKSELSQKEFCNNEYELHGEFVTCFTEFNGDTSKISEQLQAKFDIRLSGKDIGTIQTIIDSILNRSAIYITQSILALDAYINKHKSHEDEVINVHFIGSFLVHCSKYQQKIRELSNGRIRLTQINDSSVIGAGVAVYMKTLSS